MTQGAASFSAISRFQEVIIGLVFWKFCFSKLLLRDSFSRAVCLSLCRLYRPDPIDYVIALDMAVFEPFNVAIVGHSFVRRMATYAHSSQSVNLGLDDRVFNVSFIARGD